jgi:hypothetical protein
MAVGDADEMVRPDGAELGPPEGDSAWPVYERLLEARDGSDRAVGDRYRWKSSPSTGPRRRSPRCFSRWAIAQQFRIEFESGP